MALLTLLLGTISKENEFPLRKEELPNRSTWPFGEAAESRVDRAVLVVRNLLENPLKSCLKLLFSAQRLITKIH